MRIFNRLGIKKQAYTTFYGILASHHSIDGIKYRNLTYYYINILLCLIFIINFSSFGHYLNHYDKYTNIFNIYFYNMLFECTFRIPMSLNKKFQKFNLGSAEANLNIPTGALFSFLRKQQRHGTFCIHNLNWNVNMNIWSIKCMFFGSKTITKQRRLLSH